MAIPAGVTITGCTRNPGENYCNGLGYGTKIGTLTKITLQPQTAGISLAYGQTSQVTTPSGYDCKSNTVALSSSAISYGTTNNQIADISPSGYLCAGTWNRNTGGGISDYTFCTAPSTTTASTSNLPYSVAYITATAYSITSNPVAVYVHSPITNIDLVTTPSSSSVSSTSCYSQNQSAQLDAQACYESGGKQYELCAPSTVTSANYACADGLASGVTSVPTCSSSVGTMSYAVSSSSVATIDSTTNVITANLPGTTLITATLSQTTSSAGYFSTCPPESIALTLSGGGTKGTVTQGTTQSLTSAVTDTRGNAISGLSLTYESTNPVAVSDSGSSITTSYPGVSSLVATCQPSNCNPAPTDKFGLYGTGLSIASNPVTVIVPGSTSDYVWFGAPNQSQYFASISMITGNPGSTVKLPYVPNSMVMDKNASTIYFGSSYELMAYSTSSNSITTQNTSLPGVVLAVSPDNSKVLVNDQSRELFYLYAVSGSSATSYGGLGAAAAWTPDGSTLYITDSKSLGGDHKDMLYVYNTNTAIWSTYDLTNSGGSQSVAITIPATTAYLAGNSTVSHGWCPSGTVGGTINYFPQSDSVNVQTSVLGATPDGAHILGATLNGNSINLTDIGVTIPTTICPGVTGPTTPASGGALLPLTTSPSINGTASLSGVTNATAVNQVVTGMAPTTASVATAAQIAFVTYSAPSTSTTAAQLPYYFPQSSGIGAHGEVSFTSSASSTTPTAPLAGAFSPDNRYFFVSTSGDNLVHVIKIPTDVSASDPPHESTSAADGSNYVPTISPNLPACDSSTDSGCTYTGTSTSSTYVPATVIVVKPRSIT
jgi:hypothetical protein